MRRIVNRFLLAVACCIVASVGVAGPGSWTINGPDGGEILATAASRTIPDQVFVATFNGVFRSDDAGLSWTAVNTGLPALFANQLAVSTGSPERILTISAGKPYFSDDAGDNWFEGSDGLPVDIDGIRLAVDPNNPDRVYLTTFASGLWLTNDSGANWMPSGAGVLPDNLQGIMVNPADTNEVLVGVSQFTGLDPSIARIWVSNDAAENWAGASVTVDPSEGIVDFAYAGDGEIYAGTSFGGLRKSTDGATWTDSGFTPAGSVNDLHADFGVANQLFVAGELQLAVSNDGGATFNAFGAGITSNGIDPNGVNSLSRSVTGEFFAAADFSGFYAFDDVGMSWESRSNGLPASNIRALAIDPITPASVFAGYGDAFITPGPGFYASIDGGTSWMVANNGLQATSLRGLAIDPNTAGNPASTVIYSVGVADGVCAVFKSTDTGANWTNIQNGLPDNGPSQFCSMGVIRNVLLDPTTAATPGGALQTVYIAGSGRVSHDSMTGTATVLAHRIYKSTDAGSNWVPADNGLGVSTFDADASFQAFSIVVPLVMDPVDSSTLYAGMVLSYDPSRPFPDINSGIFKTTDGGANWISSSNGLPQRGPDPGDPSFDILALAVALSNPDVLYTAVSQIELGLSSDIYKSVDGGANWFFAGSGVLPTADVRALLVDPTDSDIAYAATAGVAWNPGGVFRTVNGGVTWVSISSDLERETVLALALDASGPNPRLYAGTRGGVAEIELLPDDDTDSAETAEEMAAPNGGDGNNDGMSDAEEPQVASLELNDISVRRAKGLDYVTIEIDPITGTCEQLANALVVDRSRLPSEPGYELPLQGVRFEIADCEQAEVTITYHNQSMNGFSLRNYGPTVPGDESTVQWYNFDQAADFEGSSVRITLTDNQLGDARPIENAIMYQGAIVTGEFLFSDGFETD